MCESITATYGIEWVRPENSRYCMDLRNLNYGGYIVAGDAKSMRYLAAFLWAEEVFDQDTDLPAGFADPNGYSAGGSIVFLAEMIDDRVLTIPAAESFIESFIPQYRCPMCETGYRHITYRSVISDRHNLCNECEADRRIVRKYWDKKDAIRMRVKLKEEKIKRKKIRCEDVKFFRAVAMAGSAK